MREREIKLGASPGFRLPDLSDVAEGYSAVVQDTQRLATTYVDTPDLRLARWGVSLRYRSGEGWTVKLPREGDGPVLVRGEYTFEGRPKRPPEPAVDLLRAYVREATLSPSATLRTTRRRVELHDPEGAPAAEVVDDEVSIYDGRRLAARFRELEIEARESAPDELLDRLLERLRAAGSGSPDPTPKYLRAVGPRAFDPPEIQLDGSAPRPTAGEIVRQALASSVVRLMRHDAGVRLGEDLEAVHQARVASRRLRSDLRTFDSTLEPEWTGRLRDELRWLGDHLGAVRDLEVQADRLRRRMQAFPIVRASEQLVERLVERREGAREELLGALRSDRYVELLETLVAAARQPALLPDSDRPAGEVLAELMVRPWRKLRKDVAALSDPPTDEELHQVRIRAKRARYAAEAVAPALGKRAESFATVAADMQDILGEHQDAVVAQAWLRSEVARARPAMAFAAGQLAALEQEAAQKAREAWPKVWKKLRKRRPSTW